ncbi:MULTISPECIES: enoyl-CoA hydratase/isomerase family protein [unclassified Janthinobacterium]|uniref:enoyl-CoA hydratase/isomerase family protein n=1 Tax=unclassified Janthinobacterium TaxID=2610881 RepID=UPI00034D521E|nr:MULTISPECIES: enoyl-CoA hydratase/isomerase family protein [unclassified Janthinobacterium]MEC5163325.1 2-(1,2-epoxy-1,2-dihydrophenyl)acetyl-CoA isomerase [Janthinobacterium sp. CG_S6]
MTALVLVERDGAIARLVLNRPARHNSLVPELLRALLAALDACEADAGIGALVLAHAGTSFSTGGDVRALHEQGEGIAAYGAELVGLLNEAIVRLAGGAKPVVAAVDGIVTGGALGLVLACDIVLVSARASFTPYYVDVGFSPDGGWSALLPAFIGPARARTVQLLNQRISAEQALAWGMASKLVASIDMADQAAATARAVAAKVPGSVRRTRALLGPDPLRLAAALERERVEFLRQLVSAEAQQGMRRFLSQGSQALQR